MRKFIIDVAIVAAVVLVGFAVTGHLDSPGGFVFSVIFGVAYAACRWGYRRRMNNSTAR